MESDLDLDFEHYTVAWIAPLEIEAQAALYMLDHMHQGNFSMNRGDDYLYMAGDINGHSVIIATFPAGHNYGVGSAAALASQVKKSFPNLWFGLLVGVAAGLPNLSRVPPRDIRLGDVLVGVGDGDDAGLVSYGLGKETSDGFQLLRHGAQAKTETIVRSAIGIIKALTPIQGNVFLRYYNNIKDKMHTSGTFADPGQEKDQLYQTVNAGDNSVPQLVERTPRQVSERTKVWYGPIGSGDKLMKNAQKRDELRDKFNLIGLEMEAAGTMNTIPVGVIRGVCDYGDAQKNKEWQPYAAAMAAAYAKALLYNIRPSKNRRKEALQAQRAFDRQKAEDRKACLRSLSFSNIDDRQDNIALAHPDTCHWLFKTAQFQQWLCRNDFPSHNGVLWIKGKPGAGKSTLMKHTLLYCQKTLKDYITASYFFNARGNELEKTPLGMFRSLLYQLLDQDHLLCERFIPMFLSKQKKHGNKWEWKIGELKNFLLFEIKTFQPKPLFLLIDALDECDELEVLQVVSFLESLSINAVSAKILLNICLSSRHYPNIGIKKTLELIVEEQWEHNRDIVTYVQHKLRIRNKEIEEELLLKAEHVFMWVILVVEMLNHAFDNGEVRAMKKKLSEVPSGLDEVFSTLLNKDNQNKQRTILMLQWVLFAKRLLKPEELYFAVLAGTEVEELSAWNQSADTPEMIKRFITSTSRGLIEIRKGDRKRVQFIHESVNDFLLRNKRLQTLDPTLEQQAIGASHDRLMACCMSYIMIKELEQLAKDISRPKELEPLVKDISRVKELAFNYPFLDYASTYILYHAENVQVGCIAQQALVERLPQLHKEFERLRSFHDAFQEYSTRYGIGSTLLYAASLQGYYELVQIVLKKGADVNAQGGFYGNALQAASRGGHEAVVALLLEKGANFNAQGGFYGNALQAASRGGHEAVVALLLEKGANFNAQGSFYGNALQAASRGGHEAVVALLLDKGANFNAQGGFYGNALQAASLRGHEAVVALLLEKGANFNAQGSFYGNALQAASKRGHEAVVALLLDKGADVNAQGGFYGNALQAASRGGHEAVVALLLEKGAHCNTPNLPARRHLAPPL